MGNTVSSFIHKAATFVKDTVVNVFRRIAPPIVRYVAAHPIRSFFHVVNFIVLLVPGIVTAPLLALAGFTSSGVAAGSLAACIQSAVGAVQAGGTFAVLQSAAMGGYGVATTANAVRGTVAAIGAVGAGGHGVRR